MFKNEFILNNIHIFNSINTNIIFLFAHPHFKHSTHSNRIAGFHVISAPVT